MRFSALNLELNSDFREANAWLVISINQCLHFINEVQKREVIISKNSKFKSKQEEGMEMEKRGKENGTSYYKRCISAAMDHY